jgi:hypothetical protein
MPNAFIHPKESKVIDSSNSRSFPIVLSILGISIFAGIVGIGAYILGRNQAEVETTCKTTSTTSILKTEENEDTDDSYTENLKVYENKQIGFSFEYPSDYKIDEESIFDSIIVTSSMDSKYKLIFHINEDPQFSLKVHKENYKLITDNFNSQEINKIEVFCTNQATAEDTYCSTEEPTSDYKADEPKTLSSIMYTQLIQEKGNYYVIGDYSKSRKNFAIEIYTSREKNYESSDVFKNFELIIESLKFVKN